MDTRASTRTRLSVLPVFIALIFNLMAPIAGIAVPDGAPKALQPQVAEGASAPVQVTFTLEGCNLGNGAFIEATLTCTEPGYTTGNLGKLWAELDRVPHRLTAVNNNGDQTYEIKLSADHLDDGFLGYDQISVPTVKSGPCTFTTGGQFVDAGVAGGADSTISRILTITQPAGSTCVFDYNMRLALGSAQYPGSSLRAYLIAEGVGQKSVPLPVTRDFPAQELRKTMSAVQGQAYGWTVSKSSDPTSLDFPNTCLPGDAARSASVDVTITWTRTGPTASGSTLITTEVYAKNPSERTIQVTATDNIYTGAADTNSEATKIATKAGSTVNVPANSEVLVLQHTFEYTGTATQFNDVATAVYTDPVNPDVTIPGNTTAAASAATQPAGGEADNATAIVTDSEWITGDGLSFSVAAPASGSFTNGYVAGNQVLPGATVEWSSGVVSGSGSITFTKTVYVDEPRIITGGAALSDSATVLSADGQQTLASSGQLDMGITADAEVSLTIDKTIPAGALRTGESATFQFEVYAGSEASGDPIATESLVFTAGGDLAKSVTIAGLAPGTYTVHEVPQANWATLDDQTTTIALPTCSATVEFDNTELVPDLTPSKTADDETVSAGAQIGFTIGVSNGDGIGTGIAKDVEIDDLLPGGPGVDWEIAGDSADGGTCTITGALGSELLECDFGDLAPGASASVHVVSDTTAESCKLYENTATVSASNVDEPLTAFDDTEVLCAVIELEKTPVPDDEAQDDGANDVVVGGTASFTLVTTNSGQGVASGVVLTDTLPAVVNGWTISDSTWPAIADGPGCVITGAAGGEQLLTCGGEDGVSLASGRDLSVTVSTTTTAADCGQLDNDAQVVTDNDGTAQDAGEIDVLCPDASVTKEAELGTINAGDPATFTVEVTAGGTGDSTNVEVTDTVPAAHSWTVTGDIADCDGFTLSDTELVLAGGETLSCTYPTIANGSSKSLTITSTSSTDDCADGISNTVTITADADVDTSDASNSATATIGVECPDLELVKSGSGTVIAGATVDFVIEVENIGDGDAYDLVMVDDLPELASGSWSILATDGIDMADCEITDLPADDPDTETVLRCAIDELASGDGFSVTVRATTSVGDCPVLANNALVEASNEDPGALENNGDSHEIVVECPDVSITKDAATPSVNAGESAAFEIVISVGGNGNSDTVELVDQLEGDVDDWTFAVTGDGADEDCSISVGGLLTCLFGTLEPGDEVAVSLTYQTDAGDCPEIGNEASVSATADVDSSNNQADRVTVDVNCPDLVIEKRQVDENGDATDEAISAGDTAYFEIEVTNLGPGTAFDVELLDEPESGSWTVLDDGGLDCPASIGSGGATCTAEELAPGSYTLLLSYDTTVADCGQLVNDVTVSATNEPKSAVTNENSDSGTIFVECPGLNVDKFQSDGEGNEIDEVILAGETASFVIQVWNAGPGEAKDVVMSDELPAGLIWEFEIIDGDGECFLASSQEEGEEPQMSIMCELGDLAVDESVTILVWADTDRTDCGALVNVATADGSNNDGGERTAQATIDVSCPELSLIKVNDAVGSVLPGTTVTYTLLLTVSDAGLENGEATDVTVVDVLPTGLADPTNISDGGSPSGNTITWNLGILGEGTYELTYQATVADDVDNGEELVNAAAATSPNSQCPDLDSLEPECEDTSTVVVRVPALVLDKEADADVITITTDGDDQTVDPAIVTWTLTYTLSNGPVTNAVISDELPTGLAYVDGSASDGGVYDAATNTLTWSFATLSQSGSVTFETEVDAETISRVAPTVNVAVIASAQTPEDEGEDQVTVTVEQQLGGNPTPPSTPRPRLPDTATGFGLGGEPITIPVELLAIAFLGSLGALALANVKAARGRRR